MSLINPPYNFIISANNNAIIRGKKKASFAENIDKIVKRLFEEEMDSRSTKSR